MSVFLGSNNNNKRTADHAGALILRCHRPPSFNWSTISCRSWSWRPHRHGVGGTGWPGGHPVPFWCTRTTPGQVHFGRQRVHSPMQWFLDQKRNPPLYSQHTHVDQPARKTFTADHTYCTTAPCASIKVTVDVIEEATHWGIGG